MVRHYKRHNGKFVPRAVAIAETVLGKSLPKGAIVHHIDGDPLNDEKSNLAIFPSKSYHNMIHARMDALAACDNANWRRCNICKTYDAAENLYLRDADGNGRQGYHRACHAKREITRWRKAHGRCL